MMRVPITLAFIAISGVFGLDCDKTTNKECLISNQDIDWSKAKSIYEFHANDIHGKEVSLDKYQGQVAIIVNVASQCALTESNYKQLQGLFEKYESKGLRILAFPSNEFDGQEPGTSQEILEFVKKYNVSFDMYEKILVNGEGAHPLYKWLKSQDQGAGTLTNAIKWNFTKFLIDRNGKVVSRFAPTTEPNSMEDTILKYL